MNSAFLKEVEGQATELRDRPVSRHRNFVTAEGLRAIKNALARFEAAYKAAIDKSDQHAAASRAILGHGVRETVKIAGQQAVIVDIKHSRQAGSDSAARITGQGTEPRQSDK
jgi:hypothetical protein